MKKICLFLIIFSVLILVSFLSAYAEYTFPEYDMGGHIDLEISDSWNDCGDPPKPERGGECFLWQRGNTFSIELFGHILKEGVVDGNSYTVIDSYIDANEGITVETISFDLFPQKWVDGRIIEGRVEGIGSASWTRDDCSGSFSLKVYRYGYGFGEYYNPSGDWAVEITEQSDSNYVMPDKITIMQWPDISTYDFQLIIDEQDYSGTKVIGIYKVEDGDVTVSLAISPENDDGIGIITDGNASCRFKIERLTIVPTEADEGGGGGGGCFIRSLLEN